MYSIFSAFTLLAVYCVVLYLIAQWGASKTPLANKVKGSATNYSLSLAVYCTSWTFYGNVGQASGQGLNHIALYLGSTLTFVFFTPLLKSMVRIKNAYHSTSIADFISTRYAKSQRLAALISLLCLLGITPYISIQLKSVISTFDLLLHSTVNGSEAAANQLDLIIVFLMAFFTIVFGVRKLDPTERHPGMMVALAAEAVFKLLAFLAAAVVICFVLFDGPTDIVAKIESQIKLDSSFSAFTDPPAMSAWFGAMLLGAIGIVVLPRQFHVGIVECSDERLLDTARWQFPLYLLVINLFVMPIAMVGALTFADDYQVDFVLLQLLINADYSLISGLVFLGGFAASTGMIMISVMTLSTMATNHIIVPVLEALKSLHFLRRYLLFVRWAVVIAILFLSLFCYRTIGESALLVKIGSISFVAVAQLMPVLFGAMWWEHGNLKGAISGVLGGALLWLYTSLLPAIIASGWLQWDIMEQGLFGFSWLRPEQLFGLEMESATAHSFFWTLLINALLYVLVSQWFKETDLEKLKQAKEFIRVGQGVVIQQRMKSKLVADIPLLDKYEHLLGLLRNYLSLEAATAKLDLYFAASDLSREGKVDILQLAQLRTGATGLLAGIVGMASANRSIQKIELLNSTEQQQLLTCYSKLLVEAHLSPDEMLEKVDFYQEKQSMLEDHAYRQQLTIEKLKFEQELTVNAKQSLKKLNDELEARVLHRTEELSQANQDISDTLAELRNTQQQLVEADRMAFLGGLVAGVAHEINTPVGTILTAITKLEEQQQHFSELCQQQRVSKKELLLFLKQIGSACKITIENINSAAELVANFKQVAVDQSSEECRTFLLAENLNSIVLSLQPKIKVTNLKVNIECDPALLILSYPGAFAQVITCLILNSIVHGFKPLQPGNILIKVEYSEHALDLYYSDDGVGLSSQGQEKLFEPFYTTIRGRGGSGLGGHIIYNLITQTLKGDVKVDKHFGEGFKLDIKLPQKIIVGSSGSS